MYAGYAMCAGCASYDPYACYAYYALCDYYARDACAVCHGVDAFDDRHGDHASRDSHGAVHRPWRQRFASKPPPAVAFMGRVGFEALGVMRCRV
jgi:hypothetical protein